MASCKKQSDCTAQEVCSDGQCVPVEVPEEREVRRTFATAAGEYRGQIKGETKMLEDFSEFLADQLDEAAEGRKDQEGSADFWGTVASIVGFGLGCMFGGPLGCKSGSVVGATLGAGIGSIAGRTIADWRDDTDVYGSETYGLTEEEFASFDPSQLKYMKGTYQDLVDNARDMQADLDKIDANEWKQHVLGTIGDTWNAYQMASFGGSLWEGGKKLFAKGGEETIEDIAEEAIGRTIDEVDIETILPTGTSLNRPSQDFPFQIGRPE